MAGFLEHAPGEKSTALLVAFMCGCSIACIGFAMAFSIIWNTIHATHGKTIDLQGWATFYAALSAPIGVIAGGAFLALRPNSETQRISGVSVTTVEPTQP